ncbi:MAG: polymerase, sigma-24 subunit, subfamily [Clostridia bacterium]|nr:polymerase, sigma-24 subunit, subfamily [Clostridia bacterium]
MTDEQLLKSFQSGDKEGFEELIIKYRANAVAFARQLTGDAVMAEDIAQESFADFYVNRARYDGRCSFKTYLFAIIKHKAIDYLRRKRPVNLDEHLESGEFTPEEAYLEKEQKRLLKNALELLNNDYKTAIYLIEYEELSYQEAAKVMNKNPAQMKILIFRARKKLKELMEQEV